MFRSASVRTMAAQSERDVTHFHGLTLTSLFIPLNHGSSSLDYKLLRLYHGSELVYTLNTSITASE